MREINRQPGSGIVYTAESLADLAKFLESRAVDADNQAEAARSKQDKTWNRAAASAYRDAAQILRATKIEGGKS